MKTRDVIGQRLRDFRSKDLHGRMWLGMEQEKKGSTGGKLNLESRERKKNYKEREREMC